MEKALNDGEGKAEKVPKSSKNLIDKTYTIELPLQRDIVAKLIKELRKFKNYSQEGLGKLIGVQKAQISKLEKGDNNISLGTMIKIFGALEAQISFNVRVEKKKDLKVLEKIIRENSDKEE